MNFLFIIPVLLVIGLSGCDYWKTLTRGGEDAFIIKGTKTISGQTIEFKPGTRVRFESEKTSTIGGETHVYGQLIFTNGARLIARGTPNNPIVFETEDEGGILLKNDASSNSIIEYCKFDLDTYISCENSITIQYCKFDHAWISSWVSDTQVVKPTIQYNSFDSSLPYRNAGNIISGGFSVIQFNEMKGGYRPISAGTIVIKKNNIVNSLDYAIVSGPGAEVHDNYIANCNGKTGPDTTGEQVDISGTYTNPQTSPIPNAGCGW
ncbi:MAG: hypothetical protein ABID79_04900 [Elusimicrobiota bacterium]